MQCLYRTNRGAAMTLFKDKYRIESARLKNWDYASAGWYFVTICARERECVFGRLIEDEMRLSALGEIACKCWLEIPQHSSCGVEIDTFIVMPNHVHGILMIVGDVARRDVACNVSTNMMPKMSPGAGSLGAIVRSYKSAVTRWARTNGSSDFAWQERFYDHIIRKESTLDKVRNYIVGNPARWQDDRNKPVN